MRRRPKALGLCPACGAYQWTTCPVCGAEQANGAARSAPCAERLAVEAARLLGEAETAMAGLGRRYDAACVALEHARALAAAGDEAAAAEATIRANTVLEQLGCVNPW